MYFSQTLSWISKKGIRLVTLLLVQVVFFMGCYNASKVEMNHAAEDETMQEVNNSTSIKEPQRRTFLKKIACSGTVEAPPQNVIRVHPPVQGFVKKVAFKPGQEVRKGDLLFELEHPEIIRLQGSFLEAAAQRRASLSTFNRTQQLAQTEAASQQQLEAIKATYESAEARYVGLRAELAFLGLSYELLEEKGMIQRSLPIYAPLSGIIDAIAITTGQFVRPEDLAYQLVNLDHMHLELHVFAADLAFLEKGQRIKAIVPGTVDTLLGEVYLIGPTVDPENGMAVVHGHFLEGVDQVVPGMFLDAEIWIELGEFWAVPEKAVLQDGNQTFLYHNKKDASRRVNVVLGPRDRGWVALTNWQEDDLE